VLETPQNIATRKSSESMIEAIVPAMRSLWRAPPISPAPTTTRRNPRRVSAKTPKGRFIHYGIREHGMAAAMNGIFLHGGFAPNGATFLVFTDYARPAMRLAALMGAGVVYCHDPRFDRSRRRRTDPSAGRTSRGAARHSQHARVPARRCDRSS